MRIADVDILILPGLGNSGAGHWQRRWAERFSTGCIVEQDEWDDPDIRDWTAAIVEADLRAAEFRVTSTSKPAARDSLAVRAASATAQEEASGAGLVQFGMLVTATVMDLSKQADARAAIDNLAATARLRLRPVYGSQDSAFAAALPLGLVLPKHIKVPAELREKL